MRSADGPLVRPQTQRTLAPRAIERRAFSLIITCLAICLAAWVISVSPTFAQNASGQNLKSDDQSNIVRGTVVNAVSGQAISRALVYSPDNRYATFTDSEGHFEFTLPRAEANAGGSSSFEGQPAQMWPTGSGSLSWLMARRPGFLDDPNGSRQVEVPPGSEVTITLMPEGLIKGRVTLPAADSARGVDVTLFYRQVQDGNLRWMQKNSARTNSNGEFRFAELEPGTYKVLTREWMDNDPEGTLPGGQRYGFPPVYFPSATDFASASTIQLTGGQTFEADMSLLRQPYYPVTIPAANTEENGGMNITVSPQGQRGPGYSLGYNGAKHVIEGQLPNGKYLVEGETFGPDSSASGSVNLTVAGAPAEGPAMVLARNSSIPVNVKEEFTSQPSDQHMFWRNGDREFPIHGPRLDVNIRADAADDFRSRRGGSIRQPTGSSDDSLVLENLAPGRYWLRITAHRGYVSSASMGGTDLLREPLVVVPGASTPIEITMRDDSAELDGTLLGIPAGAADSGRVTPQGFVYCIPQPDSAGQFIEIHTSSDGKFDVRSVAPGIYRVIAFNRQQRDIPYRDVEAMKAYETKGQIVHFAPGQKVTLQLQIVSGAD